MFKFIAILTVISLSWHSVQTNESNKTLSGAPCIACAYFTAMTEQLALVYNQTVENSIEKLCNYFPQGLFRTTCNDFIDQFGEIIINGIYTHETPDVICNLIGLCGNQSTYSECRLFPLSKETYSVSFGARRLEKQLKSKGINVPRLTSNICDNILFKSICDYIKYVFTYRDPAFDLDRDGHSDYQSLRGSNWKGKDCNDYDSNIRPGRRTNNQDLLFDTNCNGIYGKDVMSSISYEDHFCKNSDQKGVAVLGDSISAHFHIPEEWFDATKISANSFQNLGYFLENELDWPQLSALTGYMNSSWHVTQGPTRSIYMNLVNRNRCNHRDYQNVGVNGARTKSVEETFSKGLKRNQQEDQPLLVYFSLIGNDVCNGLDDTLNHMTKPDDFYNNIVKTLQYLDTILPNGSHVLLTGLANGTILYDALSSRIHPIGKVKNDVTYSDFYTYLTCLKLSPCNGWMTANLTLSKLTTQYAMMLSEIVKKIANTLKFNYFDMAYVDVPIEKMLTKWESNGGEAWQLIEPIDGFHINQNANALIADEIWAILEEQQGNWLGPINPYNDEIVKIFGNQNGH